MLLRSLVALLVIQVTLGEKILFYFALTPYSHRITVWPLVQKLIEKGHEVTFLSPFPPKPSEKLEKVKEIIPSALVELIGVGTGDNFLGDVLERRISKSYEGLWAEHRAMGLTVCEALFNAEDTREYLKTAEFDLVIIDALHNECGIGLAHKYGAPFIIYGASSPLLWQAEVYGYFFESNWVPDITKNYDLAMGFLEKVRNTLNPIYVHLMRHWFELPEMDKVLRDGLEMRHMPPLEELEKNVSLVLQNNHFSIELPRALPPLYVSVAGMHCENKIVPGNDSILPKEIEDFIDGDGDSDGFMLISFGTQVNISLLPETFQNIFFDVLQNFSVKFIWKWDGERPNNMPSNVYTAIWLPQQAILAHPKIKGFINQAGLLSIQEAITYNVPLIVLPIFGDQDYNAEKVQRQGYGIRLEMARLKREGLGDAISNVLNEPKYKTKMEEISLRFKDRPMNGLDSAVWWTEYVLRHKGGSGLRPLAASQSWFQRRLLDVWGFLIFLVCLIFIIILLLLRQACIIILSDDFEEDEKDKKEDEIGGRKGGRRGSKSKKPGNEDDIDEEDEDNMDGLDYLGFGGSRRNSNMDDIFDAEYEPSRSNSPIPHILVFPDKEPKVPKPEPIMDKDKDEDKDKDKDLIPDPVEKDKDI